MTRAAWPVCAAVALAAGCARAVPDPARALVLRGDANRAYDDKDYRRCAELYGQAARADARFPAEDDYGAACCLARAGDRDGAFARLDAALDHGFRDPVQLARDDDLASLHDDPRWRLAAARTKEAHDHAYASANPELAALYREDQDARSRGPDGIDWSVVAKDDAARRVRVREILADGGAKVALDYYHAAMVFQHGDKVTDYQMAHELALRAASLDSGDRQALWLAAAAKDRELMNLGKPQLYGTQFRKVDGRWVLYEVNPTVTDAERAEWNVPPLAEARRRAEAMNRR